MFFKLKMVKGLRKRKSEGVENELSNELNSEVEKNGNVTGDEEEVKTMSSFSLLK